MHYLIDAYNLLFRLQDNVNAIEKDRENLIESLSEDLARLHLKATLVFDSGLTHQSTTPHLSHRNGSRILFSPFGMSADDYIIELLIVSSPKQTTVVTSDRALAARCRQNGALVQSLDKFLAHLAKKHRKSAPLNNKKTFCDSEYEEYLQKTFENKLDSSLDS